MMPLRQFKGVPQEVIRKAEGKQLVHVHVQDVAERVADTNIWLF